MLAMNLFRVMCNLLAVTFPLPWRAEPGEEKMKFGYLNGYRGALALLVVLGHMEHTDYPILWYCHATSRIVSVYGFFALSSFLLTYRLLKELLKSQSIYQDLGIIAKYAIRRFFRIYVVFIIFLAIFKITYPVMYMINHTDELYADSWWNVLTLRWPAKYMIQLWTIPVEIKYYFCIPVICLICVKGFGADRLIYPFVFGLVVALANEYWNFVGLKSSDFDWDNHEASGLLINRFALFFYGSLAGLGLHLLDTCPKLTARLKHNQLIQDFISFISLGIIWYVIRYRTNLFQANLKSLHTFESIPTLLWSVLIILMILGDPNCLTCFFNTNAFLTSSGKYSFGIYLWHMPVFFAFYSLGYYDHFFTEIIFAMFFGAYLAGYLFYCLVEKPLMRLANALCSRVDYYVNEKMERNCETVLFSK